MALAFATEGACVIATDINAVALETLQGLRTDALDVADAAAIRQIVAASGPIDILLNCAGYVDSGTIFETQEAA